MSYSDTLEHAITNIKQNNILMQRCLNDKKLMDALKYTSLMLTELRNPKLLPKQYYELYIMIFDSLTVLSNYLFENHPKHHHLADLYELVQYAGNVLPRLYLMITVGTSYLKCSDAPKQEILKDMIEMCRGVQNPIRGLFLRYYLSQRTKELLLPSNDVQFNSNFIITNFIEMNKLWVRLQHQGPLREREQRTKERKELQILIGSQLVRLSQIIEDDFTLYQKEMLPIIIEQIIQCRDVVCQEYLLDIICQVFPDEFHLKTLPLLLNTTLKLNPKVSINLIISTFIEKLNGLLERIKDNDEKDKFKSVKLFDMFWKYLNKLNEERPDLSVQQSINLTGSLINLSWNWYPEDYSNLNKLFQFLKSKVLDQGKTDTNLDHLFKDFLTLQNIESPAFQFSVIINCPEFQLLIVALRHDLQITIINDILSVLIETYDTIIIDSKLHLERLLAFCEPLIKYTELNEKSEEQAILNEFSWNLDADQERLAKFCHIIVDGLKKSSKFKTIQSQIENLLIIKNFYLRGGENIKYTFPSIITNFWKLIRRLDFLKKRIPENESDYNNLIKQIFKYIARCINDLFNNCGSTYIDTIFKLNVQTGSLADQLLFDEIAYDFFSQAFTVFEESLTDSKTQFQALVNMTQILQKTRSLYKEKYYDSLIVRCTLHGSKLLKKQDQCRSVYLCSHLWWATEIAQLGEEEGVTENFHREGKRVLECLQRSLRAADSIMDNVQSCELMVEILNRCLYYFIHGNESETHVNVTYINGLIELIKTNLKSLKIEGEHQLADLNINEEPGQSLEPFVMATDGSIIRVSAVNEGPSKILTNTKSIRINDMIQIPIEHYARTCDYIDNQRDIDERFKAILT